MVVDTFAFTKQTIVHFTDLKFHQLSHLQIDLTPFYVHETQLI